MKRSHFRTHLKEQARKNIVLTLLMIGGLIIVLALFGVQMLIQLSVGIEKLKGNQEITASQEAGYVPPPVLNPMPDATSSAEVIVSGYTTEQQSVYLYVNGKKVDDTLSDKDNNFTFRNVPLKPGDNTIKAKVRADDGKESIYSNSLSVVYRDKPPTLEIESPSDGQTISKDNRQVRINGKTDKGIRVTVNGYWAIVQADGEFIYNLTIHDGENPIKVEAVDGAGNTTTKELKVKRE